MADTPATPGDSPGAHGGRHPTGTLAIVGIYGLLFALGWLAVYFLVFLRRGGVFE